MPMTNQISRDELRSAIADKLCAHFGVTAETATDEQVFQAAAIVIREILSRLHTFDSRTAPEREVHYLSMEFLMGRSLMKDAFNLGIGDALTGALEDLGRSAADIFETEPDAGLGNGGLGRLAACYMDSLATEGIPATGYSLCYELGIFRQRIVDGRQTEVADNWRTAASSWLVPCHEDTVEVRFGGRVEPHWDAYGHYHGELRGYESVLAVPRDMLIAPYGDGRVNTLRLWEAHSPNDLDMYLFAAGSYVQSLEQRTMAEVITKVLYPADDHIEGKTLRIRQQYFFVSATAQSILRAHRARYGTVRNFAEHHVIQINDTHPTLIIPELMRLLLDDDGLGWDEAWEITTKTCAYTNHTIMAEALEKWPIEIFQRLLPRIYQIVDEINRRFVLQIQERYPGDDGKVARMAILYDGQVKMAHLAIAAGYSVNGVARLHTEILKNEQLHDFYEMFPEKFNNKTNGITQRRFLMHGNPLLADWVTKHIGDGWITELMQLARLVPYASDAKAQKEFMEIKRRNKVRLAEYIKEHNGIEVDPDSIFDVQVKRLHEYKRQFLNILHVMYLYNELKANPQMDFYPRTFIFGAKAAAGYRNAKLTIKLINSVADVINNDADIKGKIKVVFIEDYRVSNAEWIFAAADVSEQISTASKEASGTGNMKFMLNGALTLGTMDGANVEMAEEVGMENIFIFGMSSEEVIAHERNRDYDPMQIYNSDEGIRKVVNQLVDGTFSPNDPGLFRDLYNSLLNTQCTQYADTYFILKDFRSYVDAQKRIVEYYQDKQAWAKSAILNTAHAGKFSSDRTIQEYVDEIWHLDHITVPDALIAKM